MYKRQDLEKPVARVSAVHTGANARRASADTAGGLERDLYLAKGAKVMLTRTCTNKLDWSTAFEAK